MASHEIETNNVQILSLVREESGLTKRIRSLWSAIY